MIKAKHLIQSILLTAMLIGTTVEAQTNVQIVGTSANAAGKTIGLYCYDDMLTCREVLMDNTLIDSTGAFRLGCYVNYPRLVFLQVENYSQSFYIEAGRRYEVYLPEFDWEIDEKQNVHLQPVALDVEFIGVGKDDLNLQISRFDAVVDSFVDANRVWFDKKYKPQKRYFDSLTAHLSGRWGEITGTGEAAPSTLGRGWQPSSFFGRYAEYSLAQMKLALGFDTRKKLIARYIDDQPVRYYDEPYMQLFFALYDGAIALGTNRVPQWRLAAWVEEGNLDRYLDSIGLDPTLRNEQVRELAVLKALKESYYDRNYSRAGVRNMVAQLEQRSRFDEHRKLAERLLAEMDRGEKGSEVPEFRLPDVDRNMVSLNDLHGKWVYLSFVRVNDPNSLKEIETMAHFRDSIYTRNPDVVFVSVSCDREFQKMYHFLKNNRRGPRYNWIWLHFDGNYRLLEHYGVVSFPTFLLINPEGRLHYSVTPPPASGLLLHGPWEKKEQGQDVDDRPFYMR